MRLGRTFIAVLTIALVAAACSDDEPATGQGSSSGSVSVEIADTSPIAAVLSIDSDEPVSVSTTVAADNHEAEIPDAAAATEHRLPLVGMRENTDYTVTTTMTAEDGSETTETLDLRTGEIPFDIPPIEFKAEADRASEGITLVELNQFSIETGPGATPVIGFDNEGEPVWFHQDSLFVGAVTPTSTGSFISQAFPFGVRDIDILGANTVDWFVNREEVTTAEETGDEDAAETTIPLATDWVELGAVHHDANEMPDGTLLALSSTVHPLTRAQQQEFCPGDEFDFGVVSDVVVQFERDGTVLRTWDLWDAIDVDETPGSDMCVRLGLAANDLERDWTHANSAIYDEDRDAIIVSSRHTDQIVAFDHLEEEGPQTEVRWILGEDGTIPLDGERAYHTHAVDVLPDGDLILYDNGNGRPGAGGEPGDDPPFSRVVRYAVDDDGDDSSSWSAEQVWEYRPQTAEGAPIFAPQLSDVDQLDNGNYLIVNGAVAAPGAGPRDLGTTARIMEITDPADGDPEIVWDMTLGSDEQNQIVYQAERLPSLYFGANTEL